MELIAKHVYGLVLSMPPCERRYQVADTAITFSGRGFIVSDVIRGLVYCFCHFKHRTLFKIVAAAERKTSQSIKHGWKFHRNDMFQVNAFD